MKSNAVATRPVGPPKASPNTVSGSLDIVLTQLNTAENFLDVIENRIGIGAPAGPETSGDNEVLTLSFAATLVVGRLSRVLERLDKVVGSL